MYLEGIYSPADVKKIDNHYSYCACAIKRLNKELADFNQNQPDFCSVGPINNNDMLHWQATLLGPADSPYQEGVFILNINFPSDYPFKPPNCRFLTRIYHPNFGLNGLICCCAIDILGDKWSPALSISKILPRIYSLFKDPYPDSVCGYGNSEAAILYKSDRAKFIEKAKEWTKKFAH